MALPVRTTHPPSTPTQPAPLTSRRAPPRLGRAASHSRGVWQAAGVLWRRAPAVAAGARGMQSGSDDRVIGPNAFDRIVRHYNFEGNLSRHMNPEIEKVPTRSPSPRPPHQARRPPRHGLRGTFRVFITPPPPPTSAPHLLASPARTCELPLATHVGRSLKKMLDPRKSTHGKAHGGSLCTVITSSPYNPDPRCYGAGLPGHEAAPFFRKRRFRRNDVGC
ncbi:hypothetical protein T484DRAFT_1740585 [Baffinella frigidus]|nr:hypothetical protein T484DRAFT_1740585 [Cryptophyta sp. CCMP2293]